MNLHSRSREESGRRTADIVIALSVGLLAGVAGTLLLAPASGRRTRRRIGALAGRVTDRASRMFHRAGGVITQPVEQSERAAADGRPTPRPGLEDNPS